MVAAVIVEINVDVNPVDTRVTGSNDVVLVMICTHGNVVGK